MELFFRILAKDLVAVIDKEGNKQVIAKKGTEVMTSVMDVRKNSCTVLDPGIVYNVDDEYFVPGEVTGGCDGKGNCTVMDMTPFTRFRIVCTRNHIARNTAYLFYLQYRNPGDTEWKWVYDKDGSWALRKGEEVRYMKKFFIGRAQAERFIMDTVMEDEVEMSRKEFEKYKGFDSYKE